MSNINLITNLPYEKFSNFLDSLSDSLFTQEFSSKNHFSRVFDVCFNEDTKLRLEMDFSNQEGILFVDFRSNVFYKNAFNESFETNFIFKNFNFANELMFFLDEQILSYLAFCEEHNIEAVISESISEKIKNINKLEVSKFKALEKESNLFVKYVDSGIESISSEISFPDSFMKKAALDKDLQKSGFSKEELDDAQSIFNSIYNSIQESFSTDSSIRLIVAEETTEPSEFVSVEGDLIEELNKNPSTEVLMDLIDDSLKNKNVAAFMRYSDMLKNK